MTGARLAWIQPGGAMLVLLVPRRIGIGIVVLVRRWVIVRPAVRVPMGLRPREVASTVVASGQVVAVVLVASGRGSAAGLGQPLDRDLKVLGLVWGRAAPAIAVLVGVVLAGVVPAAVDPTAAAVVVVARVAIGLAVGEVDGTSRWWQWQQARQRLHPWRLLRSPSTTRPRRFPLRRKTLRPCRIPRRSRKTLRRLVVEDVCRILYRIRHRLLGRTFSDPDSAWSS
jgi:hypothetical protein